MFIKLSFIPFIISLFAIRAVCAFQVSREPLCRRRRAQVGDYESVDTEKSQCFRGPEQSFDEMIAGVQNAELGIDIFVGTSTISGEAGLGVFACVSEGIESSEVKRGTPLVGYSKGTFIDQAENAGDKTVAFLINRPDAAIIFEKELMTAKDAIGIVSTRHKLEDLEDILIGHKLFYDESTEDIAFTSDESFLNRYFVPNEVAAKIAEGVNIDMDTSDFGSQGLSPQEIYFGIDVGNMGMYVNDLAYTPNMSEEEYLSSSSALNCLAIVWRLEDNDGVLIPTWPVVVNTKPLQFDNSRPMEMGLEYNYRYWSAAELKQRDRG